MAAEALSARKNFGYQQCFFSGAPISGAANGSLTPLAQKILLVHNFFAKNTDLAKRTLNLSNLERETLLVLDVMDVALWILLPTVEGIITKKCVRSRYLK
uniref:Uncharacterized protein n=1 Tax=Romanomermis culicivorax TaxID=13658 RepID=A0A915IYJ2_ROMCU